MPHLVLLLPDALEKTRRDFQGIAASAAAQGVTPHIARWHRLSQLHLLPLWTRASLSIALANRRKRRLLPGDFLRGEPMGKVAEYRQLEAAGVPIPKWTEVTPETRLTPEEWGPYVVEKPAWGFKGAFVRIRRTGRVKFTPAGLYPEDHPGRRGPMIVQSFVYTGEWPVSYRVSTVFGEPVFSYRQVTIRGAPVKHRWDFKGGGAAIVSNTLDMRVELSSDPEVLDFAKNAHLAAFPDIPMLKFDIGRDIETQQLFAFESHPWQVNWPFSAEWASSMQRANRVDLDRQFDAMSRIGQVLAAETFRRARRRFVQPDR